LKFQLQNYVGFVVSAQKLLWCHS